MGGDGGSIARRSELVRNKKKPENIARDVKDAAKWRHCALSQQPLQQPIVTCPLGRLYNKEAVIKALIDKTIGQIESAKHIVSLRDLKELQLTTNKDYEKMKSDKGDAYQDPNISQYICPIVGVEMNGKYRFCVLWECGCVISERALKEIKSDQCPKCTKAFNAKNVRILYGTQEEITEYRKDLDDLREKQRLEKAAKKSAAGPSKMAEKRKANAIQAGEIIKMKKCPAIEKSQTATSSIQDDKGKSDVFKSLFTTSDGLLRFLAILQQMEPSDHVVTILNDDLSQCIKATIEMDDQISGTSSKEYQDRLKSTIAKLENITRQVSQLDMFSENESLDELSTSNLRFLVLPALLGCLNDKVLDADRLQNLSCVEVYIRDFIKRLKSYGILPTSSSQFNVDSKESDSQEEKPAPSISKPSSTAEYLAGAIRNREEKMKLYREHREFKEKYAEALKKYEKVSSQQDDESLRDFYVLELNFWARKLYETYINIEREKPLLKHMAKIESGEIQPDVLSTRAPPPKPIILTRCKLQKEVFGLGYPSIPTMTVEEFFEEKTKEGQIQAVNNYQGGSITEEDEEIAKERAREEDSEELIRSERDFDEYKDDHRRGWGNTYNKG